MPDGFKLLDAYVEVKAEATGIGDKVAKEFDQEIAPAAKRMASTVEAASRLAATATKRHEDATGALRVAQTRLAEVQRTAKEGSTQLAAAEEAVAKAQRNVVSAAGDAERAQRRLAGAQRDIGERSGGGFLGGLRGALTSGAVGGLVGGVVSSVTSGVTSLISGAVSDIGGMLATVGSEVASTVIDFNSELQSANIGFTTMLGSGVKARAFLGDLQSFAKATPFDFGGLVHSAQNMLGMGIAAKDVIPDLTALGDAVASVGGSATQVDQVTAAFSQMNAKGTVDLGNMYQVINGGVSHAFDYMAAGLHVTTGKLIGMISAGDVASSKALPALIRGIEKGTKSIHGLGGMMDKQSQTFQGALSNIQDAFTQTTAKAFKPFFDAASKGMQRFATALSSKPVTKFTKDVEKTVRPFAQQIGKWLGGIDFGKIFTSGSKALKTFTRGLDPKAFGKGLHDFGKDAGDIMRDILKVAPKVMKAFKDIGPAVTATVKQGVAFIGWLADVVDWFDKFDKGYTKVHNVNKSFQKDAKDLAAVWDFVGGRLRAGWDQITGFFADRVHSIELSGQQLVDFFGGLPGQLNAIGHHMVDGLVGGFRASFDANVSQFTELVNMIPAGIRKLLGIASPSKVFHLIGTQVGQGLHLGMTSTLPAIKRSADALVRATRGRKLKSSTTSEIVAGIRQDAKDLSALSSVFHKAAADVSHGIHRGLLGSKDQIQQTAQSLIDAVRGAARFFGAARAGRMVGDIKTGYRRLSTLSGRRDRAADTLDTARSHLDDVISARRDFGANVKANVMGNADVASIFGTSMQTQRDARQAALDANASAQATIMGAGTVTLNGSRYTPSWTTSVAPKLAAVPTVTRHAGLVALKASLKKLLSDTKLFGRALKALVQLNIDPATYDEIVQAGVRGGGLETAQALLSDPHMASGIFKLERQIGAAGRKLGTQTATHEYAGQVSQARAAVRADQRALDQINLTMIVEARKIDEVQKLINMVNGVKAKSRKGKKTTRKKGR